MGELQLYAGVVIVSLWACVGVQGHGRLIEPPSRSSAWRYGFETPPNYNDHEIYCGGYSRQWLTNGGKCGPCGDPWDTKLPRENEEGGKYGLGVIVRKYKHSSIVTLGVELTANHMGYFEFRLCPHNQPTVPVTNECLDENVLKLADGSGTRYYPGPGAKKFYSKYRLPIGMTCKQCVIQWRYVAGNNWGTCENGTGMVGCGPQEQFRACADVTITEEDGSADDTPSFVPAYDEPNNVDYNEVDGKTWEKVPTVPSDEHVNHVGHVVALTFAFLLILLVIFGLIAYFYWARDAFKSFMKNRRTSRWMKTAPPAPINPTQKSAVLTISAPIQGPIGGPTTAPPPVPPRRHRSASGGDSATGSNQREIRTISNPTGVTINGIAVKPESELSEARGVVSHATLHVPIE